MILLRAGVLAWLAGDLGRAREHLDISLAWCKERDDELGVVKALTNLASIATQQGDTLTAQRDYEAGLVVARRLRDARHPAILLGNLGAVRQNIGDTEGARRCLEEALDWHRQAGNDLGRADVLHNLADVDQESGEFAPALVSLDASMELRSRIGDHSRTPRALLLLAVIATGLESHEIAACLFASAERLLEDLELSVSPDESAKWAPHLAAVRGALSEERFAELWAAGRSLRLDESVTFAQERALPDLAAKSKTMSLVR